MFLADKQIISSHLFFFVVEITSLCGKECAVKKYAVNMCDTEMCGQEIVGVDFFRSQVCVYVCVVTKCVVNMCDTQIRGNCA